MGTPYGKAAAYAKRQVTRWPGEIAGRCECEHSRAPFAHSTRYACTVATANRGCAVLCGVVACAPYSVAPHASSAPRACNLERPRGAQTMAREPRHLPKYQDFDGQDRRISVFKSGQYHMSFAHVVVVLILERRIERLDIASHSAVWRGWRRRGEHERRTVFLGHSSEPEVTTEFVLCATTLSSVRCSPTGNLSTPLQR
jgi:hypothetical protein